MGSSVVGTVRVMRAQALRKKEDDVLWRSSSHRSPHLQAKTQSLPEAFRTCMTSLQSELCMCVVARDLSMEKLPVAKWNPRRFNKAIVISMYPNSIYSGLEVVPVQVLWAQSIDYMFWCMDP